MAGSADALDDATRDLLVRHRDGRVLVLTGAGISAESGIPTFRGEEGYWVQGSRNYRPMELATSSAYAREPATVWAWYLHRRGVCHAARPNRAHDALVGLERGFDDRFLLVTQNVDGLHGRAGNSLGRTYAIHGNLDFMRCARPCTRTLFALPPELPLDVPKGHVLTEDETRLLRCPRCSGPTRPHVLWFDESYDEGWFRFDSTLEAARTRDLLIVVGTAGATNLPVQVASIFARRRAPSLVIDPDENVFVELAEASGGRHLRGPAGAFVPAVVAVLLGA